MALYSKAASWEKVLTKSMKSVSVEEMTVIAVTVGSRPAPFKAIPIQTKKSIEAKIKCYLKGNYIMIA